MSEGGTAKAAVGLAAGLGLVGVRLLDDCGRVGAKAARLGDSALDARRLGSALDDAPIPTHWGPSPGAARPRGGAPSSAIAAVDSAPTARQVGDSIAETLAEGGIEVAAQLAELEVDESFPTPPRSIACPKVLDIRLDDAPWHKLLGGFGSRCAPSIVVARAREGHELKVGDAWVDTNTLATQCAEIGAMCIFVGCEQGDSACLDATRRARPRNLSRLGLPGYVHEFTEARLASDTPVFVAAMADHAVLLLEPQ
ncbi:MAG: hypothetical protein AAF721_28355 [Myxococcota bacterium]